MFEYVKMDFVKYIECEFRIKGNIELKIEIVTTNNEQMKETGFGTMTACRDVLESIQKRFKDAVISLCVNELDLAMVKERNPDLVVLGVKYIQLDNGAKVWLSEYFQEANINFMGSTREALEFDSDKTKAKDIIKSRGLKTADFFLVTPTTYQNEEEIPIPFPLFLKPVSAANGNGIDDESLVTNFSEYQKKVKDIFLQYDKIVLAEEYLSGREFTVAIIKNAQNDELIASPIEIIPPQNKNKIRILGAKVKTENTEKLSAVSDVLMRSKLVQLAEDSFRILGVRDAGRIDIKMDADGVYYFLEANLVAGMKKESSYFPMAFRIGKGLEYDQVVNLMLDAAIYRTIIPGEDGLLEKRGA